jgi:serine/threonine protein kinase
MIGTVLGNRYEIMTEIGIGGMARVYKAKDRYLQRIVAIKVLKDEFREDTEFLKRFDTEAQAAASLTHPNIVQIYDVGRDNNRYYIVMEYVDGITLKEYIANKGSLDWRETIDISVQICSALSKAHNRNIVHRDIKPNNIIMTSDGVPKVADFGIARSVSSETDTMTIDTIGSVHYSSPEQARGGYTDAQSDIYSIGVTIFEMVTGELPFDGETPVAVALKHIQDIPPTPSSIKKGIPRALDDIILTAMAKSRQDRYATVAELINDLENIRFKQSSSEIVVPNIKHESKYDTKKLEKPLEEDLIMSSKQHKSSKSKKSKNASEGSSRKFLMPIIYILLIATILGSMYYFVRMIINEFTEDSINTPKEITLGNYVNRHIDDVKKELELNGVDLLQDVEITYEPSDTIDENFVIQQSPTPDSPMKLGGYTKLRLVVSQGTEMVKIPNVAWQDKNTVYYRLKDELGLVVDEVPEYHEEIASGMAIRTDPESGDDVKKGSRVTLYWSLGPKKEQVIVPNLVGETYEAAKRKLADAKLKVGDTFPADREGHQGVIESQSPNAGETVYEDTPVTLFFKEEVEEPGDDTPIIGRVNKTITISLPSGYEFGKSVRLRIYVANNRTGDESIVKDIPNIPVSEFPKSVIITIPDDSQVTVRAFINDLPVYENVF